MPALAQPMVELAARKFAQAKKKASTCLNSAKLAVAKLNQMEKEVTKALNDCGMAIMQPSELEMSNNMYAKAEACFNSGTYTGYIAASVAAQSSSEIADKAIGILELRFKTKIQTAQQDLANKFAILPPLQSRINDAKKFIPVEYEQGMREIKAAEEKMTANRTSYEHFSRLFQSAATDLRIWQRLHEATNQEKSRRYEVSRRIEKTLGVIKSISPPVLMLFVIGYVVLYIKGCHESYKKSSVVGSELSGKWSFFGSTRSQTDHTDIEFEPATSGSGMFTFTYNGDSKHIAWKVEDNGHELGIYDYVRNTEARFEILQFSPDRCRIRDKKSVVFGGNDRCAGRLVGVVFSDERDSLPQVPACGRGQERPCGQ